jgi:hypothetical protein
MIPQPTIDRFELEATLTRNPYANTLPPDWALATPATRQEIHAFLSAYLRSERAEPSQRLGACRLLLAMLPQEENEDISAPTTVQIAYLPTPAWDDVIAAVQSGLPMPMLQANEEA